MLLQIHPDNPDERKIKQVVECLKDGGVIIYPTDTVYGIGCDIYNTKAVEKICRIKNLNIKKTDFSIVCYDLSNLSHFVMPIETSVYRMLKKNLPGPFTFILKANNTVPKLFQSKKKTVGIRIPDNNICRTIVNELGNPIMTSSITEENDFKDYPNDPEIIYETYENLVDIVIDGGIGGKSPSTIVDCTDEEVTVVREGKGVLS
jgi:tRNA threonylcarbamoyl adenosine modification protein (Sua5/YciO/YrdC/YwlC family)